MPRRSAAAPTVFHLVHFSHYGQQEYTGKGRYSQQVSFYWYRFWHNVGLHRTANPQVHGTYLSCRFTGVAWAFSQRTDAVKVVQWGSGGSKYKVPSTICYQKDGSKTWGFDASPEDPNTLEWFKLLLVDEKDMKENIKSCHYIQKARAALAKAGKQPQEVVRDYLSLVWTSAIGSIVKEARRVVVDGLPFRVELTVPATWGEIPYASNRLYQAAVEAGILATRRCGDTELHISHEPEAAAFSTLVDARSDGHLSVSSSIFPLFELHQEWC